MFFTRPFEKKSPILEISTQRILPGHVLLYANAFHRNRVRGINFLEHSRVVSAKKSIDFRTKILYFPLNLMNFLLFLKEIDQNIENPHQIFQNSEQAP